MYRTILRSVLLPVIAFTEFAAQGYAASLSENKFTWLGSQNAAGFEHKVSVFPGTAGFEGTDDSGAPTSGTFGDGTVTAYRFFNDANKDNVIDTYASGGGRISDLKTADTDFVDMPGSQVWETTDPVGFTTTADYSNQTIIANLSDFSGSIDISGLASGNIYFLYGDHRGRPSIDLTMKDTDRIASDVELLGVGNYDQANNFEIYMLDIAFVNDVGHDTVEFAVTSSSGDRKDNLRVEGIVIDGVTALKPSDADVSIPEPSAGLLFGFAALALLRRRR